MGSAGSLETKTVNAGCVNQLFCRNSLTTEKKRAFETNADSSTDESGDESSTSSDTDDQDYRYELVRYEQKSKQSRKKRPDSFELVKQSTRTLNLTRNAPIIAPIMLADMINISTAVFPSDNPDTADSELEGDDDHFFERPYVDDEEDETQTVKIVEYTKESPNDTATVWSSVDSYVAAHAADSAVPSRERTRRAQSLLFVSGRDGLPMTSLVEQNSMSFPDIDAKRGFQMFAPNPAAVSRTRPWTPEPRPLHVIGNRAATPTPPSTVSSGFSRMSSLPTVGHSHTRTHSSQSSLQLSPNAYALPAQTTTHSVAVALPPAAAVPFSNHYASLPAQLPAARSMPNIHTVSRSVDWTRFNHNSISKQPLTPTNNISNINRSEWDMSRIQSQETEMQKELSFLKQRLQQTRDLDDDLDSESSSDQE